MLTATAYSRARKKTGYKKNISNFLNDLHKIRLACTVRKKGTKVKYQLEKIPDDLKNILKITNDNIRPNIELL